MEQHFTVESEVVTEDQRVNKVMVDIEYNRFLKMYRFSISEVVLEDAYLETLKKVLSDIPELIREHNAAS